MGSNGITSPEVRRPVRLFGLYWCQTQQLILQVHTRSYIPEGRSDETVKWSLGGRLDANDANLMGTRGAKQCR
jgi:hypothetical protein